MKGTYLIFTFLLIFTSNILIYAQDNQKSANARSESTIDWQSFAPVSEEFSVETPTPFLPGIINTAAEKTTTNRSYRTFIDGQYCFIFSDNLKYPEQHKTVFQFAGIMADPVIENVVFKFTDNLGFHHRILTIKTPKRIYTFQTVGLSENSSYLDRFFAGIKINGNTPSLKERATGSKQSNSESDYNVTKNIFAGTAGGAGSGNGSGAGSNGIGTGNGIGNGAKETTSSDTSKIQTTPLRILSKPRPPYTDFARFYEISGVVRLRLTFLADGTMGAITPISKLPFGLTEQAIAAAKQIRFEPPTRDGKALTVLKMIEYNFIIY